jgi:hypothetical protein
MTMNAVCDLPVAYQAALEDLSAAVAGARVLAEVLDYFAGQLRGDQPDPEGAPLEVCPTAGQIRRALERRDHALDAAEREWERLPADDREVLQPPAELLADEVLE